MEDAKVFRFTSIDGRTVSVNRNDVAMISETKEDVTRISVKEEAHSNNIYYTREPYKEVIKKLRMY